MKKKFLTILLVFVMLTLNYGQTKPSGSGTDVDPYLVATVDNILWIQANDTEWDKHYKQTADITLSSISPWVTIGNNTTAFTGTYDGDGYKLDSLIINTTNGNMGFFGIIDGATITKVSLTNASITAGGHSGALLASSSGATITKSFSTGTVECNGAYIGGLIGELTSSAVNTVDSCYSECTVTNNADNSQTYCNTGGLIGFSDNNNQITNCHATGNVSMTNAPTATSVGGMIGAAYTSTISKCYSTGDVVGGASGNWSPAGGFIGYNSYGTISQSYSTGDVQGYQRVGGFVGYNKNSSAQISDCYSFGNVTRRSGGSATNLGGFVGYNRYDAIVEDCYSIGSVTSDGSTNKGFVGQQEGVITACFFDSDTSNQSTDVEAAAKTTAEMQTQTTFTDSSWDFTNTWQIIGSNYPDLQTNTNSNITPVELTSFTAKKKSGVVLLTWSTATEVNNYGFEIQKLTDKWNTIGFVEGAGNSNSPKQYSYLDADLNGTASYRLKQIDFDGSFEYSKVITVANGLAKTKLYQNHPNPFNPSTQISFTLATPSNVNLSVYNILGEKVAELINDKITAGNHVVNFNASDLTSGIYIYKIETPGYTKSFKMMLLK
jgi:hypothetical protein